ncbi:hypothetical protein BZY95_01775 [Billgrantia desiderata SP1]|uniref:hypothetical protein n=1 Tax=Billgrantia desiderata TaxID=52021 RepID=UPI000A364988|nr:hypothetical protein [Halomonas desiderata]OUE46584.1 hypothetical protein BZY95_01775 [Halomonas desiderata SP1]
MKTTVTTPEDSSPDKKELGLPANKRAWKRIEVVGIVLLCICLLMLLLSPTSLSGLFNAILDSVRPVVVDVFLTGVVGTAIIVSVIIGRLLERLGFTDALVRIFVPAMKLLGVNPAVIIPSVYNIFGDINAAGKISGPILKKAGATKDEQKLAVATMVQSQQSFSTFMLGLMALTFAGVNVFAVVLLAVFLPLVIVPLILSKTIYRDVKRVEIGHLPTFTPERDFMPTLFSAAREGVELLLLILIPAVALVFAVIGVLDYIGVWAPIETGLGRVMLLFNIHPETGVLSVLVSPTLAMGQLQSIAADLDPSLVVGSFVLASSGLPLSAVFGQVPVVWAESSDLSEREAMGAAVLGIVMRLGTAFLIAFFVTPLVV